MFSFDEEQEARHKMAELYKAYQNAPLVTKFPFIEKDGKAYHGLQCMTHLIADMKRDEELATQARRLKNDLVQAGYRPCEN